MATSGGPNLVKGGLIFSLDSANVRSTLRSKQSSNILVDPNNWTLGAGSTTGYGRNGSDSEQSRVFIDDDPWGGRSIVWRTLPDSTSGPDGGWDSSYYSIDRSFTYRWSVWARRHTSGTGGTFYLGLNPAPIRNDNNSLQSNPYFTYPSQSSLELNQWFLVVGHCFYETYSGGRHPDSGWYRNGIKISDPSFGNVGSQDVRWNSSTTSANHRAYHYYTTNVNSGLEFSFPRLDKCDGTEPTISELINKGESNWTDLIGKSRAKLTNGVGFNFENLGSFTFDGTDDYVDCGDIIRGRTAFSAESWIKTTDTRTGTNGTYHNPSIFGTQHGSGISGDFAMTLKAGKLGFYHELNGSSGHIDTNVTVSDNIWHHIAVTKSTSGTIRVYVDGSQVYSGTGFTTAIRNTSLVNYNWELGRAYWPNEDDSMMRYTGRIATHNLHSRDLTPEEVLQNFNSTRGRFRV